MQLVRFQIKIKYITANIINAFNFIFLRATTPTSANVTDANAASNKKYVPVVKPVLK